MEGFPGLVMLGGERGRACMCPPPPPPGKNGPFQCVPAILLQVPNDLDGLSSFSSIILTPTPHKSRRDGVSHPYRPCNPKNHPVLLLLPAAPVPSISIAL